MSLRASTLAAQMSAAAAEVLDHKWPAIQDFARGEFKKIAADIVLIGRLRARGKITPARARLHLQMQENATKTVLLTVEGLGILAVEETLNAALKKVRDVVNAAVGFKLIK